MTNQNEFRKILINKEYQPDIHWRKKLFQTNFRSIDRSKCRNCIMGYFHADHRSRKTPENCKICLTGRDCRFH